MKRCLLLLLTLVITGSNFLPGTAEAQIPADFRRTQVFFQPSMEVSRFLGDLSDVSKWGVGFAAVVGAQFEFLAVSVGISSDYYLTTQEAPPFDHGVQLLGVRLAGRYSYPFGDWRPFGELALRRIGISANSLVRQTGDALNFWTAGAAIGFRYAQPSPLYLEVQGHFDYAFELDSSYLMGINLAVGIRSLL